MDDFFHGGVPTDANVAVVHTPDPHATGWDDDDSQATVVDFNGVDAFLLAAMKPGLVIFQDVLEELPASLDERDHVSWLMLSARLMSTVRMGSAERLAEMMRTRVSMNGPPLVVRTNSSTSRST